MKIKVLLLLICVGSIPSLAQLNVNFTVDANAERAVISPLIYGTNQILSSTDNYKSMRMGEIG